MIQSQLEVKTRTPGFASPAETYVSKRLDLNELIVEDLYSTFYLKYKGPSTLGIPTDSILVVSKADDPEVGDLCVLTESNHFKVRKFSGQSNVFGKITWVLSPK
jgi:SOS-response transcriptional repressor LexA